MDHQQYVCLVLGSARCDWLGTRPEILQHCQAEHPDSVLDNPATLVHDISKASVQTYLLRAFNLIFLLYAKVCVESGKLFHSVRFLGAADDAENYHFTLDIKRGDEQVTKAGQVGPTSLAVNTNSLLDVLGGFDGATFTVTVKRRVSDAGEAGWRCECCAPARRPCVFQLDGCQHTDVDRKCNKHELYFCQQRTKCFICNEHLSRGSLSSHYGSMHQDITHRAGSTWRATPNGRWCLVSSVAGTAVCKYKQTDSQFELRVLTPVSTERLSEFRCEVRVTDRATGLARTFTPDAHYDEMYDWGIEMNEEGFPSWNTEFDVFVDIKKAAS